MEIKLTNEQCEQIFKDGWINITVGNNHTFLYCLQNATIFV